MLKAEAVVYGSAEALAAEMRKIVPRFAKRLKTMELKVPPGLEA